MTAEQNNSLLVTHNVLDDAQLDAFILQAPTVTRCTGPSAFGHQKPRREVCYTPSGELYRYSRKSHATVRYPAHVLAIVPLLLAAAKRLVPDNQFARLSNGVDIVYSSEFPRGGSVSAHRDDENAAWGLVLILSLGQSRWLRVKRDADGSWFNVLLRHNSLVAMHGASFQRQFTHQVDKLGARETVGIRLSLNLRFLDGVGIEGDSNSTQ
jgi:alkylated DNA repair dioxygenase AlkB